MSALTATFMIYILGIPNAVSVRSQHSLSMGFVLFWPFWSIVALMVIAFRKDKP